MESKDHILQLIKESVHVTEPGATVILYGSYARGEQNADSDIDVLILVDKDNEKISYAEETKITHPLYAIEFQTGTIISPTVYTKRGWSGHRVTPFYENVNREGRVL
jgi:predicted nucleotidyltransferase